MSSPQDDDRYESYLMETWTSEVTKYDRTVLSLAGGALALSVTFIRDIAADQPRLPVLVGVGWLALILSMGLIVSSYPISKHAVEQRWNHNQKRGDLLRERAWRRSLAAGVSLSLGALLVAAFAWLNLIA
ncbi:MAG TPA: hypothetical protein VF148_02395 [Acidimicrobiia bacterium]